MNARPHGTCRAISAGRGTDARETRTAQRGAALVLAIVLLLLAGASAAYAASTPPIMGLAELQTQIDAHGGRLPARMKTVMRGSTIVELDLDVLAVTSGFGTGPEATAALIMFDSDDPQILEIGGVASGMSGSPVFVNVGQGDRLIGAVSYGDMFTTAGTGLATPIEAMLEVENYEPAPLAVLSLPKPVMTGDGLKTRVVIAPNAAQLRPMADAGAVVAKPLATLYVGGLRPGTQMYAALKRHLADQGRELLPMGGGLASIESSYSAPFAPGSAIAALMARGDLWFGGIGTATYVNGPRVTAFGHPLLQEGRTAHFLTNAWIDGVWPSIYAPYKVGRPGATRGTLTQDRAAGILGVDGMMPQEIPVTARATDAHTGKTYTSRVLLSDVAANAWSPNYMGLAAYAGYVASSRIGDTSLYAGSAMTTTTVAVTDGASSYTIVRTNSFDDAMDVRSAVIQDIDLIASALQQLGTNGIAQPVITSIDLESTVRPSRALREIVGVTLADAPLRAGENTVRVSYLSHSVAETRTIDVPLYLPDGTPTTGVLTAAGSGNTGFVEGSLFDAAEDERLIDRTTTPELVRALRARPTNDQLTVRFTPVELAGSESTADPVAYDPLEATVRMPAVVAGSVSAMAPSVVFRTAKIKVAHGQAARVVGEVILPPTTPTSLLVYMSEAGRAFELVDKISLASGPNFDWTSPQLARNTVVRFALDEVSGTLATHRDLPVSVRAKVGLRNSVRSVKPGGKVTLSSWVTEPEARGMLRFQRYDKKKGWVTFATRLWTCGRLTATARPKVTTRYRVAFVAETGSVNVSALSSEVKVTVKK